MRILHVLDISIPMIAGYTSRSRYIVNNQKALGLDPVVLTSVRFENKLGCSMEEIDGLRYHRTLPASGASLLSTALNGRPYGAETVEIDHLRKRIVEVARRESPDLIHAHSSILCGIPAYLASRQLGIPMVYEIRAFWEDAAVDAGTNTEGSLKYRAIQTAETTLSRQADALVGICQGIKGELVGRGLDPEDVFVVPNGVETDRFVPSPPDAAIAEKYGLQGKKVVAYIGTFAAFEGVPLLVKALVELIKSGRNDLRGLIVGSGATYEECRQIATAAGLADKILHPGLVPHSEVKGLYSITDVLAYPRVPKRVTELVTPLKPLEALAMEKAVVASGVGGLRELIEDDVTGLIHRPDDVADLAAKIVRLTDDPALRERLGKRGRQEVLKTRDWRKIIEGHFALYDRAKANWNRRRALWKGAAKMASALSLGR